MNHLDKQVSYFQSVTGTHRPREANILTLLQTDHFRDLVLKARGETDKAKRDALKAQLPAFTPSGLFRYRSEKGLICHSGLLSLDIDAKDNPNAKLDELKAELSKFPHAAYIGLSCSGQGLFVIVPISQPDRHRAHFVALARVFKERWGIVVDESCKDVSRLRFVSWDANPYFNIEAQPFETIAETPQNHRQPQSRPQPVHFVGYDTRTRVEALVQVICDSCLDLTASYKAWFQIAASIANEFGESGRVYFHAVSQFYPGYSPTETDKQFDAVLKTRYNYGIGTFFQTCKEAGLRLGHAG